MWKFHDSYKTKNSAKEYGEQIVSIGLAKGIKVIEKGKKTRPFLLYILSNN